jgi:phage-related protein
MPEPEAPKPTIVQQLVQQLTAPLTEAAKTFSTKVAETLTEELKQTTSAFKEAHPAITDVTDAIVGWSAAAAAPGTSLAATSGGLRDMIRNTRDLRQELTKVLDGFPILDGLRLRMMFAADAIRNLSLETIKNSVTQLRANAAAKLSAVTTAVTTAATKAWTLAQRALNLVMSLNPIGLIIAAITLLVAAIVIAYQRSTTFRNIVNAAFTAVRNVAMSVFNAIRNAVAVVWPIIVRVIQVAVALIRAYITTYFTVVRVVVTTVWNAIRTVITAVWRGIVAAVTTYINIVRTVITAVFNAVRAVVTAVWSGIRAVVTGAVSAVVRTIQGVQRVYSIVRDAFNRARSAAGDAIRGVIDFVRGLPGRVVGALGNIGRTLYQSGRDLIAGFISGLRDMAGRVVSAIQNFILDKIPGPIKHFLGISSPSRLMAVIGRNIGEGLVVGIDGSRDLVGQAMQRLVPTPRAATIRPTVAGLVQGTLSVALAGSGAAPGIGARAASAAPVSVNVYPQPGQSEYEIGRIAARELAWAAKR